MEFQLDIQSMINKIAIIDLGIGNILSLKRALEKNHKNKVLVTNDQNSLMEADKVILPGVGAFKKAMSTLHKLGLVSVLEKIKKKNKPLLGICLGMQLLMEESEEFGLTEGLGFIDGKVVKISDRHKIKEHFLKVPHIGWNSLNIKNIKHLNVNQNNILSKTEQNGYVYFIHSYMVTPKNSNNIVATTNYGGHTIVAAVHNKNITGLQFHPEKSGHIGLKILENF